jgi:phytoene/squalene synthetase
MKYFYRDVKGVNADVERHRTREQELLQKISELTDKEDDMSIAAAHTYNHLLQQLRQSKAEVVAKIGQLPKRGKK